MKEKYVQIQILIKYSASSLSIQFPMGIYFCGKKKLFTKRRAEVNWNINGGKKKRSLIGENWRIFRSLFLFMEMVHVKETDFVSVLFFFVFIYVHMIRFLFAVISTVLISTNSNLFFKSSWNYRSLFRKCVRQHCRRFEFTHSTWF